MKIKQKIGKALTWDELADIYQKMTGQRARILPMDTVFHWAEKQKDKFFVHPKKKTIHRILN